MYNLLMEEPTDKLVYGTNNENNENIPIPKLLSQTLQNRELYLGGKRSTVGYRCKYITYGKLHVFSRFEVKTFTLLFLSI